MLNINKVLVCICIFLCVHGIYAWCSLFFVHITISWFKILHIYNFPDTNKIKNKITLIFPNLYVVFSCWLFWVLLETCFTAICVLCFFCFKGRLSLYSCLLLHIFIHQMICCLKRGGLWGMLNIASI